MARPLILFLLALLLLSGCETPTASALDEKSSQWRLVFQDEFDGEGQPDPEKWWSKDYDRKPNPDGPDGWWDPANAFLNGKGQLVLRATVIENRNPEEDNDAYDFATGMVTTEGHYERTFGRFEARCKMPQEPGWWAAFWLFSNNVNDVDGSGRDGTEVDIAEVFGWTDKVNQALHWDGYGPEHQSSSTASMHPGLRRGWHTFALEWSPTEYVFFVDGRETWRTSAGGVSQVPLWIKLTGELSTEPGLSGSGWANKAQPESYPDDFLVDWVRVYERMSSSDE